MITSFLLVGIGGGVGALIRLLISTAIRRSWGKSFPWGTFIINVSGCFIIGLTTSFGLSNSLNLLFEVGMLGGYGTFSTFNYEAINLLNNKHYFKFFAYVAVTYVICLSATAIAYFL